MAKLNLPFFSGQARGKFGDLVVQKRGGAHIARIRVKPSNPRTEKQMKVRLTLKGLAQSWKGSPAVVYKYDPQSDTYTEIQICGLTDEQREMWRMVKEYTSDGIPKRGYVIFVERNMRRLRNNEDPIATPDGSQTLVCQENTGSSGA